MIIIIIIIKFIIIIIIIIIKLIIIKLIIRSSIIRNRYFWRTFIPVYSYFCIRKYIMNSHFHFITLDLPKLHTLSFDGMFVLSGNYQSKYESLINGYESYDNTLIMRSKLN